MNHQEILENSLSHKCDYCNVKFCQLLSLTVIIKLNYFYKLLLKFYFL
jgi:hypothetical protein